MISPFHHIAQGRSSRPFTPLTLALALAAVLVQGNLAGAAQAGSEQREALRRQIESRFDVLPLRDGLALRPKSPRTGARSIELAGGTIAIDGAPATGAELRTKLGVDADLILRLSYLDPETQRTLFGSPAIAEKPDQAQAETARTEAPRRVRKSEARIRFGGDVRVEADEVVTDSVVVIGGAAHIDGQVDGDVVVIGGPAEFGPHAEVSGEVTVVGGTLRREEGARIAGKVNEIGVGRGGAGFNWRPRRGLPFDGLPWARSPWGSVFSLVSTMARVAVLSLLASLVLLLGRHHVERIGARAVAEPVKAGLVGVLAQLLLLPLLIVTIVVFVITIVGIPLLALIPFAFLALMIVFVVGFTAVVYEVGQFVCARLGWTTVSPYLTAVSGILVVLSPLLLGRLLGLAGGVVLPLTIALVVIGFVVEYIAWTIGLGAVALIRFGRSPLVTQSVPLS